MKTIPLLLALFTLARVALGDQLTPSTLDPKLSEAREKVFTPWGGEEQAGKDWRELSSTHIPVYGEHQPDGLKRAIYIPNPGTGYWALDGLSEQSLWATEREKLKIGDELVSGSSYEADDGRKLFWAVWAPRSKAYLVKEKMRALGIRPASVDIDQPARDEDNRGSRLDAATLYPFSGTMAFHDSRDNVRYDLTITNGQVSGLQYWPNEKIPVGSIVGGWFDFERGRLSILIQGADHVEARWRSQLKQYHLDIPARRLTLDLGVYDYGKQYQDQSSDVPHILDKLDRIEHLVK